MQELYLESLKAIGIDLARHDIKFEEDNWEAPTLAAWGVGWQVMLDGLEITQFTYFQQCGGIDLDPMCAELTYGLERIAAFLQDVDSIYDIVWVHGPHGDVTYGDIRLPDEEQFSVYNFEKADVDKLWQHLSAYEAECQALVSEYAAATTEPKKDTKNAADPPRLWQSSPPRSAAVFRCFRPTISASSARTCSTCSMLAAPSVLPSASESSRACATSPSP